MQNIRVIIAVLLSGCAVESLGQESNPFSDEGAVAAAVAALAPPSNAFDTSTSQFIPGVDNQGWWSPTYPTVDGNANYATGAFQGQGVRSFFTFDLATLDLRGRTITSAALQVYGGAAQGDATETVQIFDVETDAAVLNANTGTSQAIYDDLGGGRFYGELELMAGPRGFPHGLLWIPLNEDARAAITAAAGGFFSVGASLEELNGFYQETVFGFTNSSGIQQLVVCFDTDVDTDGDGVCDVADDCPDAPNPDQLDRNADGLGDVCADDDFDGILNTQDNCPFAQNVDQADADGDGIGDACDNCLDAANFDQSDVDSDSIGDACDNCPESAPGHQDDTDGDGVGDVCDDRDEDGHIDIYDNCPDAANPEQENRDGDLLGDACDASSYHDLELTKIKVGNAMVRRGAQASLPITGRLHNRYDVPETVQICASVYGELPAGCMQGDAFPCSSIVSIEGLETIDLQATLPIACGADATAGSYRIEVAVEIYYEAWNGYDEDLSDNWRAAPVKLQVR